MTQTQIANNIQLHYLTGLPSRDNLYNDIASQPKGNLHLLLFSIAGFPYLNLPPWENDRLIVKTAQMLSEMLPEGAALYQWRDYSFAVLLPYYNLVFSQKWQNQVLTKAEQIKLPAHILEHFSLLSTMVSSPPIPMPKFLQEAETGLQAAIQSFRDFSFFNLSSSSPIFSSSSPIASSAKAKEYIQFALARLWAKDPYFIYLHNASAIYAKALAVQLDLSAENIKHLATAALWQDVAMNELPLNVLCGSEPLQNCDWQQIKKHPVIGAELLKYLNMDEAVCEAIRYHHENWNSGGYPNQLKGTDIPINARILRICTSWASLQLPRPWRNACNMVEALTVIQKGSGIYYDPALVKEFRNIVNSLAAPQASLLAIT
jgi:HD-GYP domain-containing protein (c-di-GMP phosphodiesterase class II)